MTTKALAKLATFTLALLGAAGFLPTPTGALSVMGFLVVTVCVGMIVAYAFSS